MPSGVIEFFKESKDRCLIDDVDERIAKVAQVLFVYTGYTILLTTKSIGK
jgi:hypothetical protein